MMPLLMLAIVLTGAVAALAYTLATYALPFMAAIAVAYFAYATGAGYSARASSAFWAAWRPTACWPICSRRCVHRPRASSSPLPLQCLPPSRAIRWYTASSAKPFLPLSGGNCSALRAAHSLVCRR